MLVKATPGLFLDFSSGPGRQTYKARGFEIDNSGLGGEHWYL